MLGNMSVMGAGKCIRSFVNDQKLAKRRLPGSMLPSGCERITGLCTFSIGAESSAAYCTLPPNLPLTFCDFSGD